MNKAQKKGLARCASFLLLICLCLPIFSACSSSARTDLALSPALSCLASQSVMAKSALVGSNVSFSPDDFARALNLRSIEKITVTSVPPVSDGQLRVGSTVLNSGELLSAASVALMTFVPSGSVRCSEFKFKVDDLPYELCCKLYLLDEQNFAPTLSYAPRSSLEVSTHKNVTYFGTLACYDPDGDQTYIEIVSYPEKGLLVLDDVSTGSYRYIPYASSTGKDEFVYVARDMYGNYSASAVVSLDINRADTHISYVDLIDTPYHNSALTMTEKGIMSGSTVGGNVYFYPNQEVSRAEFVVMAMNAAGITDVTDEETVFADNADIPVAMRKYVATAHELGYIKGSELGEKLCFEPNRSITRAEAAVILANILDAAAPTMKPTFKDAEDIPTWAEPSINSLSSLGIMTGSGGSISPLEALNKGDAANMLCTFMEVRQSK